MFDFISLMMGIFQGPLKTLARDKVLVPGGVLIVSTINTHDQGWETAILDKNAVHPVERHNTKEEAVVGHARWTERMQRDLLIMKLGYGTTIESELVICIPMSEEECNKEEQNFNRVVRLRTIAFDDNENVGSTDR
jgi:hypothetical protein